MKPKYYLTFLLGIACGLLLCSMIFFIFLKPESTRQLSDTSINFMSDPLNQQATCEKDNFNKAKEFSQMQDELVKLKQELSRLSNQEKIRVPHKEPEPKIEEAESESMSKSTDTTLDSTTLIDQKHLRLPQEIISGLKVGETTAQINHYYNEGGQVPTYTAYAYRWMIPELINHHYYLVDKTNSTGIAYEILNLTENDLVLIEDEPYRVAYRQTIYPDQYASDFCDLSYPAFLQTCYSTDPTQGMLLVTLKKVTLEN